MRVVRFVMLLLVGAALGLLAAVLTREAGPGTLFLTVLLAPFLATFVHEAGHVLAGLAAGMAPVYMVAGPLALSWRPERLPSIRAYPAPFGGFALCVPPPGGGVRRRMIAMTAGGPLASLALAVAAGAFWFSSDGAWRGPVAFIGIISALLFAGTAIPYIRKGMRSDGAKVRMLLRNGKDARALCADLVLLGEARRGVPPSRWPREQIDAALAAGPGSPERVSGLYFACYAALDASDRVRAGELMRDLRMAAEGMSESIAGPAAWEAAAFALFAQGDPDEAGSLIEGRKPVMFQDGYLEHLVRAGLAAARGNREEAMLFACKARAALGRALFPGWAVLHGRWLARLEAELAAAVRPAGTAA